MDKNELAQRFTHKAPTPIGVRRIQTIRDACAELSALINENCPEGREKSLAVTKLEEVSMWANKSIVFDKS